MLIDCQRVEICAQLAYSILQDIVVGKELKNIKAETCKTNLEERNFRIEFAPHDLHFSADIRNCHKRN